MNTKEKIIATFILGSLAGGLIFALTFSVQLELRDRLITAGIIFLGSFWTVFALLEDEREARLQLLVDLKQKQISERKDK